MVRLIRLPATLSWFRAGSMSPKSSQYRVLSHATFRSLVKASVRVGNPGIDTWRDV